MRAETVFVDTNVFIYAYSTSEITKREKATAALQTEECMVSTQVLSEFCNVCRRKLHLPSAAIRRYLDEIIANNDLYIVNDDTIRYALTIQEKYGFSYYDSLIVAAALEGDCDCLLTEDLQDGQKNRQFNGAEYLS